MTSLPAWIDPDAWAGFVEMRKRQEAKSRGKICWTARAEKLILAELYKLKDRGHDPNLALDQSALKGWSDVYAAAEKEIPNMKRECMTSQDAPMTQEQKESADKVRRMVMGGLRRVS